MFVTSSISSLVSPARWKRCCAHVVEAACAFYLFAVFRRDTSIDLVDRTPDKGPRCKREEITNLGVVRSHSRKLSIWVNLMPRKVYSTSKFGVKGENTSIVYYISN